ncbi:hypothetical protein PsorP6_007981 [Peronosclerospora sorghi]|uniref:Uncharacterized protein n=1 Tax=Peronosclerospora sorghi TaxID=230839 RepID=A0ACC0WBT0_9STRA|nr:hypothetical protein PsorP6_007981 [Peronosclerospora sorghi]
MIRRLHLGYSANDLSGLYAKDIFNIECLYILERVETHLQKCNDMYFTISNTSDDESMTQSTAVFIKNDF